MQEGSMTLPADWIDKTMNVFVSAATGTEGVSFVEALVEGVVQSLRLNDPA
ncbi:hypothethical protein (plasmid) [Ralstonia solanacearum CMR15]|nr:hypothethical protein [Ralstonia solanacearum CMR15]